MRLSASEKYEIIQTVTQSELSVKKTLQELGIAKSTFYKRPPRGGIASTWMKATMAF